MENEIDFAKSMTVVSVATDSGNQGKHGKWMKIIPCREKSGNLKFCQKSGNFTKMEINIFSISSISS